MKRAARSSGGALLLATVVVVVISGIVAAYMSFMMINYSTASGDVESEMAFVVAESGIDASLNELNAQIDYASDGLGAVRGRLGGPAYEVSIEPSYSGLRRYVLRSIGAVGGSERRIVGVAVPEGVTADRFANAVFGDFSVEIGTNASVDSYDSREGDYDSKRVNRFRNELYAGARGHVKSNGTVRVGPNAKVFGDVTAGSAGEADFVANAHVEGVAGKSLSPEGVPPIAVPAVEGQGSRSVLPRASLTLDARDHHYASLVVGEGATLKIQGPATVILDDFRVAPGARVVIDGSNGPVTLYGTGAFQLDPAARWESTKKQAGELTLRITTDTLLSPHLPVEVDAAGRFYGTIYAPNATLNLDSQMELFGAVSGGRVNLGPSFKVHYDETLAPVATGPNFRLVSYDDVGAGKKKKGK